MSADLETQGIPVKVLDRVRQVGPRNQGGNGRHTVYQVAEPAGAREGESIPQAAAA